MSNAIVLPDFTQQTPKPYLVFDYLSYMQYYNCKRFPRKKKNAIKKLGKIEFVK